MSDDTRIVSFIITISHTYIMYKQYYVLYTNIWFNWMMIMSCNLRAFPSLVAKRRCTLKSPACMQHTPPPPPGPDQSRQMYKDYVHPENIMENWRKKTFRKLKSILP